MFQQCSHPGCDDFDIDLGTTVYQSIGLVLTLHLDEYLLAIDRATEDRLPEFKEDKKREKIDRGKKAETEEST